MQIYRTKDGMEVTLRMPEKEDAKEIIEFYKQVGKETTHIEDLVKVNIKYQKNHNLQQSKK